MVSLLGDSFIDLWQMNCEWWEDNEVSGVDGRSHKMGAVAF